MFVLQVLVWMLQHATDEMMDDLLGDPPPGKGLHLPLAAGLSLDISSLTAGKDVPSQ
ncbi:hypothetical protein D4764_01G0008880 [Takifugu flavidus]|uniref:Uncharacterized protein n=1 Tax=Takifugu flavidus TaxID=433684 RepID=A0A5C6PNP0_9TELE|nr:hypothetical protein D4764_01G0008880 [Takifugu flavidus]